MAKSSWLCDLCESSANSLGAASLLSSLAAPDCQPLAPTQRIRIVKALLRLAEDSNLSRRMRYLAAQKPAEIIGAPKGVKPRRFKRKNYLGLRV